MKQYLIRRFYHALLVLVGISLIVFLMLHLTGDPAALLMPLDAKPEEIAALRQRMGFDEPLYVQYGRFFARAVRGDFGQSFRNQQPAMELLMERMPATLELAAAAIALALAVALPVGIVSALRRNSWLDHAGMVFALIGQSMPVYWLGILLILIFAVQLGWFPAGGRGTLAHLALPAVTLGLFSMARVARFTRSAMLEALAQDYVRTARAKGLPEGRVVLLHAFKNAALPIVTIVGLDFATLLGGAVITETIFGWPGVGRFTVEAIGMRDFPVVQASVFLLALIFVAVNLAVDVFYTWLDPRIRYR
jgi:ABC-type dipeptide/oligopeptide/nickel transport system permease component